MASTKHKLGSSGRHRNKVHYQAHSTELDPSKQKRCISEHEPDWTLQADTYRRGALVSTEFGPIQKDTERRGAAVSTYKLGPSGRHNRQGALVSTGKQNWAPPDRSGASVSTNQIRPSKQTYKDVVHW